MKLLLLHGSATNISRKKLTEIKAKFDTNNVVLFESNAQPQDVLNVLTTPSLLESEQLIIWENTHEDFTCTSSSLSLRAEGRNTATHNGTIFGLKAAMRSCV